MPPRVVTGWVGGLKIYGRFHYFTQEDFFKPAIAVPGGVRLGAHALTSRGMREEDFVHVVQFLDEAVEIAREAQGKTKKLKDYKEFLETDEDINKKCQDLKKRVSNFASNFPMPGHSDH